MSSGFSPFANLIAHSTQRSPVPSASCAASIQAYPSLSACMPSPSPSKETIATWPSSPIFFHLPIWVKTLFNGAYTKSDGEITRLISGSAWNAFCKPLITSSCFHSDGICVTSSITSLFAFKTSKCASLRITAFSSSNPPSTNTALYVFPSAFAVSTNHCRESLAIL